MTVTSDKNLHLGASWYPEMWPEEEWPKDIKKMQEVGFTLVRLFEFAWKKFEPSEGEYQFDWALRLLDQLHEAGIHVMLGTPSAAPPAWLTTTYPDVLVTKANGKMAKHGQRKHGSPHSETYRSFCEKIVTQMAEYLGSHPAVHSWQLDNEMSGFDYGVEAHRKFHLWLEQKYETIEKLNQTWGLQFWSQAYDTFSQIPFCEASVGSREIPERNHPSLIMAIAQFQNQGWSEFMKVQIDAIRNHCSQPITTNMTGLMGNINWCKHFQMMDRAGVSSYADLSYVEYNTIKMDRLRPMKEDCPYWLLETAPNWSGGGPIWNIHHNQAGLGVYTWLSIFLGGSMVLYWQWRSHWAGQEMQHGTCVDATGKWMPGKEKWKEMAGHFQSAGKWLLENPAARGPVALMTSNENAWLFTIDPIDPSNRYDVRIREDYYMPIVSSHLQCDLINPFTNLSDYKVLVCPHMSILPEETKARITTWVKEGGRLILGPMTGTRTEEMTRWTDRHFGGLEELMGAESKMSFSPHWVEEDILVQFGNGSSCHPKIWCEAFEPGENTEVLAHYQGGYGDGLPAVVENNHVGKGKVITVGCPLEEDVFITLLSAFLDELSITPLLKSDKAVRACPRCNAEGELSGLGIVNTTKSTQKVQMEGSYVCQFTQETVKGTFELKPLETRLLVKSE